MYSSTRCIVVDEKELETKKLIDKASELLTEEAMRQYGVLFDMVGADREEAKTLLREVFKDLVEQMVGYKKAKNDESAKKVKLKAKILSDVIEELVQNK